MIYQTQTLSSEQQALADAVNAELRLLTAVGSDNSKAASEHVKRIAAKFAALPTVPQNEFLQACGLR